jgi:hypothetical protein
VELDSNGCRVLSGLPEPGVHPRVFFTADEYPRMRERLNQPHFKAVFGGVHKQIIAKVRNEWGAFAEMDFSHPSDEEILRYFTAGEGRNIAWGVTSLTAVLMDDEDLQELMTKVVVNYAHIILASKQRALDGDLTGEDSSALHKRLEIWGHDRYDVGVSWTFGAAGYAVSYDVLFNRMSETQRETVRRAIAAATSGRKSYGNGMPRGYASSNHYGYHGDLAVLLAAIEGDRGFDRATWDGIVQVLRDYWEVGYTPLGVSREDGYGPNLGLRGGGRGFMVLARRGANIFATKKYRNYLNYVAMEYDPYPGGHFNGGASGGPYGELYPTSTLISRYMYPESSVANFNYRQLIGENYERRLRWQGWLDFLLYGADWKGPAGRQEMLEQSGLPLSVHYPVRGKFIARSDWSSDAMYVTLDARPDAHLIGHDKVDRGNFSMSALGRVWAFSGDFHNWDLSNENSLVHIDGNAQAWKAPSVRFLWHADDSRIAGAAVDLKYAYDWQWTPPWPKWGQRFDTPWEPESNSPLDLGWPRNYADPDLCPPSIHGSETGYAGTNNLHRRPFNPVRKAFRSLFLIRGRHPYTLICDDIRKDDQRHLYQWIMQLPMDLEEVSNAGNDIILKESDGDRRLLVRFLQEQNCSTRVEPYRANKHPKDGKIVQGRRLVASLNAVEPGFRVMLYPFRAGDPLPTTQWNHDRSMLAVRLAERFDKLAFSTQGVTSCRRAQ